MGSARGLEKTKAAGSSMSGAAASSYWRVAGMSYLRYANLCADMVRASLKEPLKSQALKREVVFVKSTPWEAGKPGESVMIDYTDKIAKRRTDARDYAATAFAR